MTTQLARRRGGAPSWTLAGLTWALLATLSGCTGGIEGDGADRGPGQSGPPPSGVDLDDLDGVDPETLPDGVPPGSRVLRLGYDE